MAGNGRCTGRGENRPEKLKGATDYLGALTKAFANQTAEDANDVKDSLVGIYDSFAEKSEAAAKKVSKTVKTMTNNQKLLWQHYADEVVDRQKKVQEVFTNTSDTAKNAFKDVTDAMAQVSSAETRVELDELQGRQSDIEQRRYQTQRDDLKAQQAEAIAKGGQEAIKNITSALRISEQVYNERIRQANNEKAQALRESQVSTSAPNTRTTQPAPQKIIRLEYPGGAVNVGIDSTDETKLLEALKNAGMRTV